MSAEAFGASDRAVTIAAISKVHDQRCVLPEMVPVMVDRLDARALQTGRYDVSDPKLFAELVGADLRAARDDAHLNLRFDPAAMTVAEGGDDDQPDPQMLRQIMCVPGRRARHEWTAQWAAFRADGRGLDLRWVKRR